MHGTIESGFRVELRRLDELAAFASDVRDLTARALAPNAFYEPSFMAASAPVFGRDVMAGLVWRRGTPARLIGFFPVRDRAPPLRHQDAGARRLDPSLWTARHAADRPRRRRRGGRGLARSPRRRSRAAEAHADAVSAGRGRHRPRVRCRARPSRRPQRAFRAAPPRDAGARRATAPAISTTRSRTRSARSCAGSASGSRTAAH